MLLDLHRPRLDGRATTQRLRAEFPAVRVLILSPNDHALAIGQVMAAGAQGYVLNNASHDEILVGIRAVAAGKRFLGSELGLTMLGKVLPTETEPTKPTDGFTGIAAPYAAKRAACGLPRAIRVAGGQYF
ncbi:hypothetical protein [Hymenobacter bucti]|uniref:Response regulatory domain-containing protein n=1 Tax=Hymenobacter bucti TaxID=1844114 RepID=A0ABW4QZJ6_9BACT